MRNGYKVNNLPQYANNSPYVVASLVDGELWFYGAYSDEERAIEVADMVGGVIC